MAGFVCREGIPGMVLVMLCTTDGGGRKRGRARVHFQMGGKKLVNWSFVPHKHTCTWKINTVMDKQTSLSTLFFQRDLKVNSLIRGGKKTPPGRCGF